MDKIKMGVVGVGYLGELHAQKYASMDDVLLEGVADSDFKRAKEISRRYDTKAYGDYRALLPRVEGLSLAVPTVYHHEIGKEILARGIHVLIEKPIALHLEEADSLIEEAIKGKTVLQVGHIERFNPAVLSMESMVSNPIFIEAHRLNYFTNRGLDMDVVLDLMIHDLDIILHMVDSDIRDIDAAGMRVLSDKIDIANARITFENKTVANLTASRFSNESVRTIRVFQPDSYISVDYGERRISLSRIKRERMDTADPSPVTHKEDAFPDSDPLADQIRSFMESIRGKKEPRVPGTEGRKALAVALSIIDRINNESLT